VPSPSPYETFGKTMHRVLGLILLHSELHGVRGRPKQHVSDILRGALVLAVGALDALILESVLSAIPAAARQGRLGPKVAKWIKEEPEAYLAALVEEDPVERVAVLCREQLGAITFQRSAMIEGVMRDVLRCDPPWSQAAETLADHYEEDWDEDEVKEQLDEFVARRHRIAHSGDVRPNSSATQPIQRPYVERGTIVIIAVGTGGSRSDHGGLPLKRGYAGRAAYVAKRWAASRTPRCWQRRAGARGRTSDALGRFPATPRPAANVRRSGVARQTPIFGQPKTAVVRRPVSHFL
jgi:hypothetical protein